MTDPGKTITTARLLGPIEVLETRGAFPEGVEGLAYDSRKVRPGSAFVALRGTRTDGHRFLEAAGAAGAATNDFLLASELRAFGLNAALAVLSNTAVDGQARTAFDARIGLIADLHAAGAAVVVASLWPAGDRSNAELMAEFYARLRAGGDIVEAFANARRARIDAARPENLRQWAGFQLFIR